MTAESPARRIYTIPMGEPFLMSVARAVLRGDLPSPGGAAPDVLGLTDLTLLLPTRRAVQVAREAFLEAAPSRSLLLPRIRALSEGEDDFALLAGLVEKSPLGTASLDIPPAIGSLERHLALAALVTAWSEALAQGVGETPTVVSGLIANTPAKASQLAAELCRLMDLVEREGANLDGLANLVPVELAHYWQLTTSFLGIVTTHWPAHLAERGVLSPVDRRNQLMRADAERLRTHPPKGPVIVAGVTNSTPAMAELLRAVLALPNGALVLPGLDRDLDAASWEDLTPAHPEHPQFGMKRLLDDLGVLREEVGMLPGLDEALRQRARMLFMSEVLRPASTTDRWHELSAVWDKSESDDALANLHLIEADSQDEEANTIALILRHALETPGRTAALVTPDRTLARRVSAHLATWEIEAPDAAGRPLGVTPEGAFLDLVVTTAGEDFAPPALMALLTHPLCRLGLAADDMRTRARALELAVFRAPYMGRGLKSVERALATAEELAEEDWSHAAARRVAPENWGTARELVARLKDAFTPLATLHDREGSQPLAELARAHAAVAEALARLPSAEAKPESSALTEVSPVWQGDGGEAAADMFAVLRDNANAAPLMRPESYADFYRTLVAAKRVKSRGPSTAASRLPSHPRVFIWDLLSAQFQAADVMVLGGLNDGVWPRAADPGPWLSRPMREALGLSPSEEATGVEAQQFVACLGAETVYLTRALKVDGTPTVPSRWVLRLRALTAALGCDAALKPPLPWRAWAWASQPCPPAPKARAPEPRPPLARRPRKLSVSAVETWIANPYAVFAKHILKIEALPRLGAEPGPAERGSVIHEALARFTTRHPEALPEDAAAALLALMRQVLADYGEHPRVAAFWIPRFESFARWFADTEPGRRKGVQKTLVEVPGKIAVPVPGQPFTLTARADRIDVSPEGLIIRDYKTKSATGIKELASRAAKGIAPQLILEAAIAMEGGFERLMAREASELRYLSVSGGEPPGEDYPVALPSVADAAAAALENLARLVTRYDRVDTPYRATRRARFSYDYDDYAHLARVGAWANDDEEAE